MTDVHNQVIDRAAIVWAVEDSFGDVDDGAIREDYSGRGMYGAACFALVGEQKEFMKFFVALAFIANNRPWDENFHQDYITDLIDAARFDDMGLAKVMYFPGWSLTS